MSGELPLLVENLTFRYQARPEPAIQDVSFALRPGEIVLVAGASGCGKTTLIRCINGLIPRTYRGELQGRILVYGRDARAMSMAELSQQVGTLLQDPERQIVGSFVLNEVAFGLENLGLPRSEILRRVDEALAYLGISHLRDRETFYLSGGEKQKVALAGLLAMRPRILLLDEPLASLDPASAQEALALFRRLADEGISILLVEHRVEDALSIRPDRVLFLQDGRVAYEGPPEGMTEAVDYRQVKLPAPLVLQRAADAPPPIFEPAIRPNGREPLVVFEDVTFAYDEEGPPVIRNVNLTIRRGDIVAVLGPNGAGKTTLVKHAIGLLKPRRGRVLVEGRDTRELSVAQVAHTVGYVFQSPSHMLFAPTVREELAFGPKNLGFSPQEIAAGVAHAVEVVNLKGLEDYPPLALSFGQQKRVSIAAILAMRSRILAMDEPTAGQDYWNYMAFMDSILQMPGFAAVLFITHDLDLAICYANRVILMAEGEIVADGPPEVVLADLDRLRQCRIVPTSLLRLNLEHLPQTGRFLRAEALAHAVAKGVSSSFNQK
ncbi:MAG: energy-coupling factor ABC transporter ATP-binding protein [Anaerolineae bacterium]|nr:energy-coupling factor ABC transporter ATP-binding protein [Anaerolineae bacterium]MCX8068504.1 energy-coupling factor ABC transporter ATP-binding protein [Anaerolineae bacterium]